MCSKSGGGYLLIGIDCPPHFEHNDFESRVGGFAGYLMITTSTERRSFPLRPLSQTHVFYPKQSRGDLSFFLHLQKIRIPPNTVLVGHGYLQHAVHRWKDHHSLRYHIYVKPMDHNLKEALEFAYGASMEPKWSPYSEKGGTLRQASD